MAEIEKIKFYLIYYKKDQNNLYAWTLEKEKVNRFLTERCKDCFYIKKKKMDGTLSSVFMSQHPNLKLVDVPLFDGKEWRLQSHNELEPNTKLLISEIEIESLADFKNGALQINAYKMGKPYKLQPMLDVNLRVDPVKFYKLHTFCENDFFDEDAFIVPVVENGVPVKTMKIDNEELKKKMLEKQKVDITAPARKQDKKQMMDNGPLVIDLHATELLDTTAGMSHADILNYQLDVFRKTLEEFKKKKGMKIIFIHGKGDGVLRNAVVHELRYRYKSYTYQDASFQEYGYGATQVTIH